MEEEKETPMKKCENCGKEVQAWNLDRYGECTACRAEERATDMGVGDLNTK